MSKLQQFFGNARGDAETRGGIFAIGDDQIDSPLLNQVGQIVREQLCDRVNQRCLR